MTKPPGFNEVFESPLVGLFRRPFGVFVVLTSEPDFERLRFSLGLENTLHLVP